MQPALPAKAGHRPHTTDAIDTLRHHRAAQIIAAALTLGRRVDRQPLVRARFPAQPVAGCPGLTAPRLVLRPLPRRPTPQLLLLVLLLLVLLLLAGLTLSLTTGPAEIDSFEVGIPESSLPQPNRRPAGQPTGLGWLGIPPGSPPSHPP
jgi:hypothetical protein